VAALTKGGGFFFFLALSFAQAPRRTSMTMHAARIARFSIASRIKKLFS
jgi:hypothetical protein